MSQQQQRVSDKENGDKIVHNDRNIANDKNKVASVAELRPFWFLNEVGQLWGG